ncbi:hypothetical protein H6S61_00030 [Vibrio vulnificus]|uniref:hypothetical protein n=1 Tax=Vibrio vulnificus TaxID=672 RepID=UPI00163C91CB|nr:hypothetical protein [Vibrio vulnificus]QNE00908.1 hypothetical protein H6S61_00030 [Vibrio vulnificus]
MALRSCRLHSPLVFQNDIRGAVVAIADDQVHGRRVGFTDVAADVAFSVPLMSSALLPVLSVMLTLVA